MFVRLTKSKCCWLLSALGMLLLCSTYGEAKRPPVGGGGGSDYAIVVLDPQLPGPLRFIWAGDVNDHNSVVGYAEMEGEGFVPIFWSVSGGEVTTLHLGGLGSAYGVNNYDEVVGERRDSYYGQTTAVYWSDPLAASQDLPLPAGHVQSTARKINDQGFIVGWSANGSENEAVAWRVVRIDNLTVVSEPLLLGGTTAIDVAQAEQVAAGVYTARVSGTANVGGGPHHAVTWELGSYVDEQGELVLEVITGPTDVGTRPGDDTSSGDCINTRGDVSGRFGFRKLAGQPIERLLPPSGVPDTGFGMVWGMNEQAEVVGYYLYGMAESVPVLWRADGTPVDMNKYSKGTEWAAFWHLQAINNTGTIVGKGLRYTSGKKNSPRVEGEFMLIPN